MKITLTNHKAYTFKQLAVCQPFTLGGYASLYIKTSNNWNSHNVIKVGEYTLLFKPDDNVFPIEIEEVQAKRL